MSQPVDKIVFVIIHRELFYNNSYSFRDKTMFLHEIFTFENGSRFHTLKKRKINIITRLYGRLSQLKLRNPNKL